MRPVLLPGLLAVVSPVAAALSLGACNQDSYASSPTERETHMGEIHATAPPTPSSSESAAAAPSAPPPATSTTGASPPPSASR